MNDLILKTLNEDKSNIYIEVSHNRYDLSDPKILAEFLLEKNNLIEGFGGDESHIQHYYDVIAGAPNFRATGCEDYYREEEIVNYMDKNKNAFSWVGEYMCKLVCSKYIDKKHLVLASPIYCGEFSQGKISNINIEHTGADLVLLDNVSDVLYVCEAKFYSRLNQAVTSIKDKCKSKSGFNSILDSSNDAYYHFQSFRNIETGEKIAKPNCKVIKKIFFVFVLHQEPGKKVSDYSRKIEEITFNDHEHNIVNQCYTSLGVSDKTELCKQIIKISMERK